MTRAVIVDDEYYAQQGLKMELDDIDGIDVVGMYDNGEDMLRELNKVKADLIFLDIEMPEINGLELFEKILDAEITPYVVFVTAYNEYAVKAFEINAFDYIVKPVTKRRLKKTLERMELFNNKEEKGVVSVNCFKHFSIMIDGKDINSGWRTKKAEELIAYLVSGAGAYVTKDKLAGNLWPDLNQKSAMSNLYTAYYYIKKQEKNKHIKIPIESGRGKMRINIEHMHCDFVEFEKMIKTSVKNNIIIDPMTLEKVLELYKGKFLEDSYYDWAIPLQNYLEMQAEGAMKLLAAYYRKEGNGEKTLFYEKQIALMND